MQTRRASSRISLSNILVATDFSQASKVALPYAVVLARQYEANTQVQSLGWLHADRRAGKEGSRNSADGAVLRTAKPAARVPS
jgi:hypothetical protein